jgi:hypothetical protein
MWSRNHSRYPAAVSRLQVVGATGAGSLKDTPQSGGSS